MSRKVIPIRSDPVEQRIVQLHSLLSMIEGAAPREVSAEALERAGFVSPPKPPPDAFLGRRILAWIEEREARRLARALAKVARR